MHICKLTLELHGFIPSLRSEWNLKLEGLLGDKWLTHWMTDPEVQGCNNRDFFSPRSLLSSAQKVTRCILKVFSPEVYTSSFRGDVRQSVPGVLHGLNRLLPSPGPC